MSGTQNQEKKARECENAIRQMMAEARKNGEIHVKNAKTVAIGMATMTWGKHQGHQRLFELTHGD